MQHWLASHVQRSGDAIRIRIFDEFNEAKAWLRSILAAEG